MAEFKGKIAIYALTEGGCQLAKTIAGGFSETTLFLPEKYAVNDAASFAPGGFSECVIHNWPLFDAHIFIMATGIVVRKIAPLLEHKTKDPAVVVCDEAAKFAISLLSGHIGGANRLASDIATLTGAQAVITTATDVQGVMAFDEIASREGWIVKNPEQIKTLNTLLLERGRVAVCIPESICQHYYSDKKNIFYLSKEEDINSVSCDAVVVLNSKYLNQQTCDKPILFLQDEKQYVIGIGCRRGVPAEQIERNVMTLLLQNGIELSQVKCLASCDVKKDEQGLFEFAEKIGCEIKFYPAEQLNQVAVPTPSDKVMENVGTVSVAEASALIASKGKLIVPKQKYGNMTVAIASYNHTLCK